MTKLSILKWVGAIWGIAGAILLAVNIPISGWGWVLYLVSSVAWVIAGVLMKERSLVIQSVVFSLLNLVGIIRWLF